MPVIVSYAPRDTAQFQARYGNAFQQWINQNPRHTLNGQSIEFDEAYVLNGFHSTTSGWGPNPVDHVTVRLSNAELRERKSWYTLHWRPNGGSRVGPRLDSEEAHNEKKKNRKEKNQRYQANKKRRDRDGKDGPEGGSGVPIAEPGAGLSQAAGAVV